MSDPASAVYYLCGPGGMVSALQQALHQGGIAYNDIRTEEFAGYGSASVGWWLRSESASTNSLGRRTRMPCCMRIVK